MSVRVGYDTNRDPPAPVLPMRLGTPGEELSYSLVALVDSGADTTVIPLEVANRLRLPRVSDIGIRGVGGLRQRAQIHSVVVEVAGFRGSIEAIALGSEGLIGRDLLNRWVVTLRGPEQAMEVDVVG
jgi:predicted aspartyl protease